MEKMDVVAAVIEKDGMILIAKRKEGSFMAGRWEFPGGKVEKGETYEEALKREIMEELSVTILVKELMYEDNHIYDIELKKRHVHLLFYKATLMETDKEIKCIGCSEYKWVLPKELGEYDFVDGDLRFVSRLADSGIQ